MKLKINKACDLSSISVLPPHSRCRRSNSMLLGTDSSAFGKSQASQLRSQQSQQSFSQGLSSQLSQNSLDEILTNEQKYGSQERENSVKRASCLAPITYTREESQIPVSRSSNNLIRKWSSASVPDHRCQVTEELEHRIGLIETSLSRFGMILDSVQSDVMQVNKAVKEVSMETEGIRQKLIVHDNSLQLMLKGEEDIKASLDRSLKSIPDQLRKDLQQHKLQESVSVLSTLPEKIEARLLKLQNELCGVFTKEMEAMANSMKPPNSSCAPSIQPPKRRGCHAIKSQSERPVMDAAVPPKVYTQANLIPKIEMGRWDSLKQEQAIFTNRDNNKEHRQKEIHLTEQERERRIVIESDDDSDGGFSCLLEEKELGNYLAEKEAKEETERILRKARRRKRKYCNPIILN